MSSYLATWLFGTTVGWFARSLYRCYVPEWIEEMEDCLYVRILEYYARYNRAKSTNLWGIFGKKKQSDAPWLLANNVSVLPWTAVYHQSSGRSVTGECATHALKNILWDLFKDKDGFICVDYIIKKDPTIYRIALNCAASNTWPYTKPANTTRPALLSAELCTKSETLAETIDVGEYFRALEGPNNNLGNMTGIPIGTLLLDCHIPIDTIERSTIVLKTISGTVVMPVTGVIDDAHQRLCALCIDIARC